MSNKKVIRLDEVFKKKKKILIATLYSPEPVMLATTQLGPDKLILLIDQEITAKQQKSMDLIKGSLGKVINVETIKTHTYDIVEVAKKCVDIIDNQNKNDQIYINITSGRKTKAIGLFILLPIQIVNQRWFRYIYIIRVKLEIKLLIMIILIYQ